MDIARYETGPRLSRAVTHSGIAYLAGIVSEQPKRKSTAGPSSGIFLFVSRATEGQCSIQNHSGGFASYFV